MYHETLSRCEYPLKDYEGAYIGLHPTDESAVGFGEFEVTIDRDGVTTRCATGLDILEEFIKISDIRELSEEEAKETLAIDGLDNLLDGSRAFAVSGLLLIFFKPDTSSHRPQLLVKGGAGDRMRLTMLFSPLQVEQGLHTQIFRELEYSIGEPGDLPRLRNNGLPYRQD